MVAPPRKSALYGTVLVRFLTSLGLSDAELSNDNFAERMSRLIGLSDSINIAQAHRNVSFEAGQSGGELQQTLKQDFDAVRQGIEEVIDRSFGDPEKAGRLKMPVLKVEDGAPEYEPYQRFYMAQQREMDYRILPLWSNMREAVAGASPEMAQLAAIDTALGESLVPHAKELFGVVPRLLKKRFEQLHDASGEQAVSGEVPQWLKTFRTDMQELLFAELEVRLLPVIGLLEAVEYGLE